MMPFKISSFAATDIRWISSKKSSIASKSTFFGHIPQTHMSNSSPFMQPSFTAIKAQVNLSHYFVNVSRMHIDFSIFIFLSLFGNHMRRVVLLGGLFNYFLEFSCGKSEIMLFLGWINLHRCCLVMVDVI